jgi:hypothetical protein
VLTGGVGEQRGWAAHQDRLARLSANSVHTTVHRSTHGGLLEDRRFASVTSRAIADVVRAARGAR